MLAMHADRVTGPARAGKDKVHNLEMDCWGTALVSSKGHRIGLHISSNSKPASELHPNTYEPGFPG